MRPATAVCVRAERGSATRSGFASQGACEMDWSVLGNSDAVRLTEPRSGGMRRLCLRFDFGRSARLRPAAASPVRACAKWIEASWKMRMCCGSQSRAPPGPALRANPGLNDGIPLGFSKPGFERGRRDTAPLRLKQLFAAICVGNNQIMLSNFSWCCAPKFLQ